MSNPYCTADQFRMMYDANMLAQMSNDRAVASSDDTTIQFHLDIGASEFETVANGRIDLPITNPPVFLTKLVAALAVESLMSRRMNPPKDMPNVVLQARRWLDLFSERKVSIPNVDFQQPELTSSGTMDGTSIFDHLPFGIGGLPTDTSTSKGK